MAASILNEFLCFIVNNFGKVPKQDIISTLVGFYDEDEVVEAKQTLFRAVDEFDPKVSDSPRLKTRSKASNKRRLECADAMGLLVFLDKRQLMGAGASTPYKRWSKCTMKK